MKKKRILALLLAASMSLSLAACGGGDKPSDNTPAGNTETPGGSTAAQTEITWWAFPTFGVDSGYEQEVAEAFMAANPDVKVNIETIDFTAGPDKLTAAISAGTAPDVLFDAPGRIIEYGNAGYLAPLDDMMEALKDDLANENLVET